MTEAAYKKHKTGHEIFENQILTNQTAFDKNKDSWFS